MGLTDEQIAERLADENDDDNEGAFVIWPENVRPIELFLACRTQWRVGAMGGVLGLDYQGVAAVMRIKRVKDQEAMLTDLQAMESAALEILNEKK